MRFSVCLSVCLRGGPAHLAVARLFYRIMCGLSVCGCGRVVARSWRRGRRAGGVEPSTTPYLRPRRHDLATTLPQPRVMTWADDELHAKLINGTFQMWLDSSGIYLSIYLYLSAKGPKESSHIWNVPFINLACNSSSAHVITHATHTPTT